MVPAGPARPDLFESGVDCLAIAVGITPQLLPAVVSMSLAAGSRQMAGRKVLVKRLVCIEDLGDVDTLFTDKTGTLTQGRISFMRAVATDGTDPDAPLRWGLTWLRAKGPPRLRRSALPDPGAEAERGGGPARTDPTSPAAYGGVSNENDPTPRRWRGRRRRRGAGGGGRVPGAATR